MRKTILFLTLLLLAGCKEQPPAGALKVGPAGPDNDSPIIISDTTTVPTTKNTKGPGTQITRMNVVGSNPYFHEPTPKNFRVHDLEDPDGAKKDTYRAACFDFPSGKIPIPPTATKWRILFEDAGGEKLRMTWADHKDPDADGDPLDIALHPDLESSPDKKILSKAVTVAKMTWSIDGGPATIVPPSGVTLSPGATLVTVHYCSNRPCSLTVDNKQVDPCAK